MNILVQFPTLARKKRFLECLRLYVGKVSGKHHLTFNINCDLDDLTMNNADTINEIKEIFDGQSVCFDNMHFDRDTTKISAINDHINIEEFDVVICASDDMIPYVDGWDHKIATAMQDNYPDTDGCVSFSDGRDVGNLITFSIMGRKLYERFGYIYHPDYKGLYCDNEFTDEVNRLGKVTYIDEEIIGHEHYAEDGNRNSGKIDYAARKTLHFSGRDGIMYEKRKELGFPRERISHD